MVERVTEGEKQVPDRIWELPHFQNWLQAQKGAGNRLDGFKPVMEFYVTDGKFLFFWAAHVDVYVAAEDRNKTNEIVISRPDIKHVVCVHKPEVGNAQVVLVREFRSPASTPTGFILESPGGSSFKDEESAQATAVEELFEETGIRIDPERLVPLGARQLMGTMSAHKAHAYAVYLSAEEMETVRAQTGFVHGNEEDSERTWVEIHNIDDLFEQPLTDWSTLGMLFAAYYTYGMA